MIKPTILGVILLVAAYVSTVIAVSISSQIPMSAVESLEFLETLNAILTVAATLFTGLSLLVFVRSLISAFKPISKRDVF